MYVCGCVSQPVEQFAPKFETASEKCFYLNLGFFFMTNDIISIA